MLLCLLEVGGEVVSVSYFFVLVLSSGLSDVEDMVLGVAFLWLLLQPL